MKRERHGRAKILTPDEIQLLFNQGLETIRDRALFGFCLSTPLDCSTKLVPNSPQTHTIAQVKSDKNQVNMKFKYTVPTSMDIA